jgi:hypothetical protein
VKKKMNAVVLACVVLTLCALFLVKDYFYQGCSPWAMVF